MPATSLFKIMRNLFFKILFKLKLFKLIELFDRRFSFKNIINYKNKTVIMCGPITPWGTFHQRPQNFAKALSNQGYNVIYCILPYSNVKIDRDVFGFKEMEGVHLLSSPNRWHEQILKADYVYTCYPWHFEQLKKIKEKFPNVKHVHDVFDDIEIFSSRKNDHLSYKKLTDISDLCWYSADAIRPAKKSSNLFYVPNGCDLEHFGYARKVTSCVGYVGAIDTWFDFEFLKSIALKMEEVSIYIVGKINERVKDEMNDLLTLSNVIYLGPVAYEKLPLITTLFDYGIIPFKINDITLSTSPIKMFEYLASNCQVISTKLPEVLKYQENVFCVDSYKDAIEILRERKQKSSGSCVLENASWEKRISDVLDLS